MATPYHGKTGVVYMSSTGAGTAVNVVQLTEWSLDRDTDKSDVTSFNDPNKIFVQGTPNLAGRLSGWWDSDSDQLFDAAESTTAVKMYLYPSANAATVYFYGTAWVDASISVPVTGGIAVSANFVAASGWGRRP
jgi:hypothetical protein